MIQYGILLGPVLELTLHSLLLLEQIEFLFFIEILLEEQYRLIVVLSFHCDLKSTHLITYIITHLNCFVIVLELFSTSVL